MWGVHKSTHLRPAHAHDTYYRIIYAHTQSHILPRMHPLPSLQTVRLTWIYCFLLHTHTHTHTHTTHACPNAGTRTRTRTHDTCRLQCNTHTHTTYACPNAGTHTRTHMTYAGVLAAVQHRPLPRHQLHRVRGVPQSLCDHRRHQRGQNILIVLLIIYPQHNNELIPYMNTNHTRLCD